MWRNKTTKVLTQLNTLSCLIKVNSNIFELTVHPSCYCILDLLCVTNLLVIRCQQKQDHSTNGNTFTIPVPKYIVRYLDPHCDLNGKITCMHLGPRTCRPSCPETKFKLKLTRCQLSVVSSQLSRLSTATGCQTFNTM